jgi:hypothetical protein
MMTAQPSEDTEIGRLEALGKLLESSSSSPIGDTLLAAIRIYEDIKDPIVRKIAEEAMRGIRVFAARAVPTDVCFLEPPKLPRPLSDIEYLQLVRIEMTVHELCYCCEMLQDAANKTSGGSSPTRFYLNGFYHYASSLFLVDTSKKTHKDLPMGGTVIRALSPMGLGVLLDPVKAIFDRPIGDISFGEVILNLRHSDLVHGDFSPERVEYLVRQTQLRDPRQQEEFAHLIWLLFHRIIVLDLQLLTLIASSGKDLGTITALYLRKQLDKK